MISRILFLLNYLLLGNTPGKARLNKQLSLSEKINIWIERNFYIISLAAILILLFVFIWVCFTFIGGSAVESGNVYNHFNDVIWGDENMRTKFGNAKLQKNGYYQITSRKEGNNCKYLHRLLFEDFYGCEIPEGFNVHHIDGNKQNNCIMNLQLLRERDHVMIHSNNNSNYYRVSKQPDKTCKQGFIWHYRYSENSIAKAIASVDLKRLELKVIAKGLPWFKIGEEV